MDVFIRFELPREDAIGPTLGPYPYVQLTYEMLTVGPDGEELAHYDGSEWWLLGSERGHYSDIVVYAE